MVDVGKVKRVIKEIFNIDLYPSQIKAIMKMRKGYITNIDTGEGKTIIIAALAVLKALDGEQVVVITPNEYLNVRDFNLCNELAEKFGLKCCYNSVITEINIQLKTEIYESDIIYSTCSEFVFDYLRGKDYEGFNEILLKKSLIIDEIDQILVDNSNTNFTVSMDSLKLNENELNLYTLAKSFCRFLVGGEIKGNTADYNIDDSNNFDFIFNKSDGYIYLTERGNRKVSTIFHIDVADKSSLPLISAIHNTLRAVYILEKCIDYTVLNNAINIIDRNNGRVKINNQYSSGLNLALELKEGCEITDITDKEYSINGLFLFSQFNDLTGCSGTSYECRQLFRQILKVDVKRIKRNKRMDITLNKPRLYKDKESKYEAVQKLILDLQSKDLPILIVAENDNLCYEFYEKVKDKFEDLRLLTNDNLDNEIDIIERSGLGGSILVSTLISGRGTDIKISDVIAEHGGLQVIFLSRFQNKRAEKQIIGRTGRQGKKGEIHFFSSLDDEVFNYLSLKEKKAIGRYFDSGRYFKIEREISKLQDKYSRKSDSNIINLYKRNNILSMFENYLEHSTPYVQEYLYEVESYITGYTLNSEADICNCIVNTKKFISKILEGGKFK